VRATWAEDPFSSRVSVGYVRTLLDRLHQDGSESAAALFATHVQRDRRPGISAPYILGKDSFGPRGAMQRMDPTAARYGVQG